MKGRGEMCTPQSSSPKPLLGSDGFSFKKLHHSEPFAEMTAVLSYAELWTPACEQWFSLSSLPD